MALVPTTEACNTLLNFPIQSRRVIEVVSYSRLTGPWFRNELVWQWP